MNKLIIISTTAIAAFLIIFSLQKSETRYAINPIIGDISFISKFGFQPNTKTNEDLRIKTHLEYVEKLLRKQNISNLSPELQQKRNILLDLLHDYWTAGIYPRNYDYQNKRQPCFIDKNGRICAVGYLVEQTANRKTAEQINSTHKYDKILAMNDHSVDSWIEGSGLTKHECAMIQPTYGPPPVYTNNYISPSYGIASSVFGGINLSLITLNGIQISKAEDNLVVPVIGLATGVGQIALGLDNLPAEKKGMYITSNESQKVLSFVNITLGTTTIILSTWNLIAAKKPKEKLTSWSIYGIPAKDNAGLAFYLSRRF